MNNTLKQAKRTLCAIDGTTNPDLFDALRSKVDIVCVGDSITGWNNAGDPSIWPFTTYPHCLEELLKQKVVNGGVAGEVSENGIALVKNYLRLFPNAKQYIIGFGTNDLAYGDVGETSRKITENIETMTNLVSKAGCSPLIINVPYVNESVFPENMAKMTHAKRDYHNRKLAEKFAGKVPIVDICSKLKNEHFGDNLHPNEAGARIIAQEVYKRLTNQYNTHL